MAVPVGAFTFLGNSCTFAHLQFEGQNKDRRKKKRWSKWWEELKCMSMLTKSKYFQKKSVPAEKEQSRGVNECRQLEN